MSVVAAATAVSRTAGFFLGVGLVVGGALMFKFRDRREAVHRRSDPYHPAPAPPWYRFCVYTAPSLFVVCVGIAIAISAITAP